MTRTKTGIMLVTVICFLTMVSDFTVMAGPSMNDSETLVTNLLNGYNIYTRPTTDQSEAVNVSICLTVNSITEFNDVLEKFSFAGAVVLYWNNPRLSWDPAYYGGLDQNVLPYNMIWIPELSLSSAATSKNVILQDWNKARIWSDGGVQLPSANLIESACAMNVLYYPFDTQSCEIAFFSLGYLNTELSLRIESNADLSLLQPNAVWGIVGTHNYRTVLSSGETEVYFVINLKRKSSHTVLNVLLPILFLAILNALVFLLIPESGERIGYCITSLLAIAVYMMIVTDTLPQSSDPVPLISYKLVNDPIGSVLIVLVVIINMGTQNNPRDQPIPRWLTKLYQCLNCSVCCKRSVGHYDGENLNTKPVKKPPKSLIRYTGDRDTINGSGKDRVVLSDNCGGGDDGGNPSWKDISKMLD